MLAIKIERRVLERQGHALTNFSTTLPAPDSDLARESLKDPYRLDFLGLGEEAEERAIEDALIEHVTEFLLELGAGFAFIGRQVHLEVGKTIGLLLCRSKNNVVAQYALEDNSQPLGIAEYRLAESLPEPLQTALPSIEQIERELSGGDE